MTSLRIAFLSPRFAVAAALAAPALTSTWARAAGASPTPTAQVASSVGVEVDAVGVAVDEKALRAAVANELGLLAAPSTAHADTLVLVRLEPQGELTVTYRPKGGAELSRTVAAPGRADELPEITALLVGNLARDEAGGLLGELKSGAAVPATENAGAQGDSAKDPIADRESRPVDTFNLSLVHPVTLLSDTENRRLAFELGLFYGRLGALSGVAINLGGVAQIDGEASGLQLAGIGYIDGGLGDGARLAGLFGVGKARFEGVSLAGAVLVQDGELSGLALSGVTVIATGAVDGGQLSAAFNYAKDLEGVQGSAGANVAMGDVDGVQATAGGNVAGGNVEGAQLAAGLNFAGGNVEGAQLSSGLNLADNLRGAQIGFVNIGGDVEGLQLGLFNIGRNVSGAQLGLVNVARDVDGVSLGLVPYSQRGRTQFIAWYNTGQTFNVGVRFRTGVLYGMPTFAYDPAGTSFELASGKASYSAGFSLGVRIPIDRASVDIDSNYSNRSNGTAYDEHDVNLRHRVLVGWQFTNMFGVFAGGGIRHHFRTKDNAGHEFDPELSLGVELL